MFTVLECVYIDVLYFCILLVIYSDSDSDIDNRDLIIISYAIIICCVLLTIPRHH